MNQEKYINSYKPHARVYVDHLGKYIKVFVIGLPPGYYSSLSSIMILISRCGQSNELNGIQQGTIFHPSAL